MRSVILGLALLVVAMLISPGGACAVGFIEGGPDRSSGAVVGKNGDVPDTLNKVKEALVFLKLAPVIDRFAGEIKAILGQFGIVAPHDWGDKDYERMGKKFASKKRTKKKRRKIKVPKKR